ncbi:hypothetical protein KSX_20960 [Ktedonospora formicarum]|uniref:Uncharacterized protein n=1 Tax=Ktedonospora formicarum TaxID=2778364 RepID=A0A8J3MRT9_9CHLR|nr:hypothetical protein KSX_20960 [Ktedonospora formicarum]
MSYYKDQRLAIGRERRIAHVHSFGQLLEVTLAVQHVQIAVDGEIELPTKDGLRSFVDTYRAVIFMFKGIALVIADAQAALQAE